MAQQEAEMLSVLRQAAHSRDLPPPSSTQVGTKVVFEDEMRALGKKEEVMAEFESYFSGLVGDVEKNNQKYVAAMQQLEELLALEKETMMLKNKVATYCVDYDDDLVIFRWTNLLKKKKNITKINRYVRICAIYPFRAVQCQL